jgi:hypothetical protein
MLRIEDRSVENWNRLLNYYRNVIFSYVLLPDGCVYRTSGGIPSGCLLTADDNTLVHFLLIAFCWLYNGGGSYDEFKENAVFSLYGDDNTYSYSDKVADFLSPEKIISAAKKLNVVFEDAGATWDNIIFLGHSIRLERDCEGKQKFVGIRKRGYLLSSFLLDGDGSWELEVQRVAALRIQAFFHPDLFLVLTNYMEYMLKTHDSAKLTPFWSQFLTTSIIHDLHFCP